MDVLKRLKKLLSASEATTPVRTPRTEAPQAVEAAPSWPFSTADFDRLGKTGETIGERIISISSRLADLQALQSEFASFSTPVHEFLESHAQAQARLAEAEALLGRARNENDNVRLEYSALRRANEELKNELAETRETCRHLEETGEEREYQLKNLRAASDEAHTSLDWVQRQLSTEVDKGKQLTQTNRRLAGEIERLEQHLNDERAKAVKLQDAATFSDGEIAQLRESLERVQPLYATTKRRLVEVEAELQNTKQTIAALELKLTNEREGRQNADELREQERVAHESELAFSMTQFESLNNRHDTTVKLLEQARGLIAEKSEETRMADRALKEAVSERTAVERRVTALQEETRRLSSQLSNADELLQDMKGRSAMLTKALAAKDALVAQQTAKNESLAQQAEAAALRFEQERAEREGVHRKLIEELERERAERALAQGALSIARASREKLIEQLESIKRKRPASFRDDPGTDAPSDPRPTGNVHAFRSQESALEK